MPADRRIGRSITRRQPWGAFIWLWLEPYCSFPANQHLPKFAGELLSVQAKWGVGSSPVNLSGQLAKAETFWHLDVYATRTEAEAARASGSIVVVSLGKTWLLTIADQGWRPSGGERIAEIGPLPIIAGRNYSAQYMEAIFTPGMVAPTHTHAGPEAWYTLAGETCLETPQGKQIGRASCRERVYDDV